MRGPRDPEPIHREGISGRRSGAGGRLRPCTPHPCRRRLASRQPGSAGLSGRSSLGRHVTGGGGQRWLRQWRGELSLRRGLLVDENHGHTAGRRECNHEPFHHAAPVRWYWCGRVYQERDCRTEDNLRRPSAPSLLAGRESRSVRDPSTFASVSPVQLLMNASRWGLIMSGCVVHIPCDNLSYTLRVPFFRSFAESSAESAIGTIWSSSRA